MSFLTIPSQDGLFTTVKTGRSTEEQHSNSPADEDEDEDTDENARLLPRSSPIPRKRGRSIYDETAEYMRIRLALPARRVSFADTTGGELVDVKEFVAFDSDEEDDARWEEEEAKYRPAHREPTYRVIPEFGMPTSTALTHAVHTNKVEVESVSPVEDEPLAFSGFIRVLNISFNKAVYIRSTMDSWATYFDYPADYVEGSNDGETDKFSFKLSFAPPYVTHGSRIEFVVRFETPEGDYWANNSHLNYVVTLLLSYEDDLAQASSYDMDDIKGILKPSKMYSMEGVDDFEDNSDKDEEDQEIADLQLGVQRPTPVTLVCPVIVQPEIDLEAAADEALRSPLLPNPDLSSTDVTVSLGEQTPDVSCTTTSQTHGAQTVACLATKPLQTTEPELLPKQDCKLDDHFQEEPKESRPSTPPHAPVLPPHPSSMSQASDSEEEGGTPNLNHSEPDTDPDPLYTEIQFNVPSLKHLTNLCSLPTMPDVEREQVEQGSEEEEEEQGSEEEEEDQRQEAESETVYEMSFIMQEPATSSTSRSEHPSVPDHCEHRAEDSPHMEILPGITPPPPDEIDIKLTLKGDDEVKDEEVLMETGPRLENSQAGGEEVLVGVVATCMWPPHAVTHHGPTGEDSLTRSMSSHRLEPHADLTSRSTASHQHFKRGVAAGLSQLAAVLEEDSSSSTQQDDSTAFSHMSSTGSESSTSSGAVSETVPPPGFAGSTSVLPAFTEVKSSTTQDDSLSPNLDGAMAVKEEDEDKESFHVPSDTFGSLTKPNSSSPEAPMPLDAQSDQTLKRTLIPSIAFLSAAIFLTAGFHDPSIFLVMGLFLVSLCF